MNRSVFAYRNDVFCAETIPLPELAETAETPFLCTSANQMWRNMRDMASPFVGMKARIDYIVSAKPNLSIMRSLADCKCGGAAVSSAADLERALEADIRPDSLILCGARYDRDALLASLLAGVRAVRIESFSDLRLAGEIAQALSKEAPVFLRVDLGVESGSAALSGFALDQLAGAFEEIVSTPGLAFAGLAVSSEAYLYAADLLVKAYGRLREVVALLRGQGIDVPHLDLGLAPPDVLGNVPFSVHAELIREMIGDMGCSVGFQAGRRLIGDATLLVARVMQVRKKEGRPCLVLDAAPSDLPVFLSGGYEIVPLYETSVPRKETSVIGSRGGEGAVFKEAALLPELEEGDRLALLPAGLEGGESVPAAGSLSGIAELLVSGARRATIRRRVAVAEQMAWENLPVWMGGMSAA